MPAAWREGDSLPENGRWFGEVAGVGQLAVGLGPGPGCGGMDVLLLFLKAEHSPQSNYR